MVSEGKKMEGSTLRAARKKEKSSYRKKNIEGKKKKGNKIRESNI